MLDVLMYKMYKKDMKLTVQQSKQIAAESMTDPRTVVRIYEGRESKVMVRERVAAAAAKLQMPAPPAAATNKKQVSAPARASGAAKK